jgi:hypothetical protein
MKHPLQLAEEATQLKQAFLFLVALTGNNIDLRPDELEVRDYQRQNKVELRELIKLLRSDVFMISEKLFPAWRRLDRKHVISWFSSKYRAWLASGQQTWDLGRVSEVEAVTGPLPHRNAVDCPPYAQVVFQGFFGAAIRHPEYHLARDLALHMNLLLDAEEIEDFLRKRNLPRSSEVSQSLSRSVILTCYNLLESFTSGLVAASHYEKPSMPESVRKQLVEPERKRQSLKCRFADVPCLITGRADAMAPYQKLVLDPLFSEHKWRRDAFVHCEPGPSTSRYGIVKEDLFHEADIGVVRETVSLTVLAIQAAWKEVYGRPSPSWLPPQDCNGRFPRIDVRIVQSGQQPKT